MLCLKTLHSEVDYSVTNVLEIKNWFEEVVLNLDSNNIISKITHVINI